MREVGRSGVLQEAYRRAKGPVAYLDESYQTADPVVAPTSTFYIFTAVIVQRKEMAELRDGLSKIADDTFWHTTEALQHSRGRERAGDMLEFLAEGPETCIIAYQVPVEAADNDGEAARRACYRSLAIALAGGCESAWDPVELLVLEERNQHNFRKRDELNHRELVSAGLVPRQTRLLQTSPSVERLLWLPDLVASAYRRRITHRDGTHRLFDLIADRVHFVDPLT
ncbi:hypothetical protein [Nocardia sp. NPDC057227]|uniref:hypothetical protein n=1 Tax=Nocardia sp. NPDC057227 TaxID=3346056 RepID=UPI0036260ABD